MNAPLPVHFHPQPGWEFYNPVKLTVGRGCRQALVEQLADQTLLIVTTQRGRRQFTEDALLGALVTQNRVLWVDGVRENPGLTDLQAEIDRLQGVAFDAVIAFGGGSAMDAAKAERGSGPRMPHTACIAAGRTGAPCQCSTQAALHRDCTSGTGSEVTPFATVWHHEIKKKLSLAGPAVWPTVAFVDAALTDSVPLTATISTGLDAINQAAESLWNRHANPITLGYAIRALQLGFAALPQLASGEGGDAARDQMAEASVLAGLAISNTRTALCHSISYPMTSYFGVPHGLACAFTMPAVLRHNLPAEDGRFAQAALALTGRPDLHGLVDSFDDLHAALQVRERVQAYIPTLDSLLSLEKEMFTPGRADNTLQPASRVNHILDFAWQYGK